MPFVPQRESRRCPDLPDPGSLSNQLSERHTGILSPKSKMGITLTAFSGSWASPTFPLKLNCNVGTAGAGAPQLSAVCSWEIGVIKAIKVDKDKICP